MTPLVLLVGVVLAMIGLAVGAQDQEPAEPEVFLQGHDEHSAVRFSNLVQMPDETLLRYGIDTASDQMLSQTSEDGGRTWGEPKPECAVPPRTFMVFPLLDRDGEIHLLSMVGRGQGEIAVTYFIDVWHRRTTGRRTKWEEPSIIYEGYCGAILDFKQLSTGRLVAPFAWWVPKSPQAPPVGANLCTVFYSDDGGRSWLKSPDDLSSPCYSGFVGNNYGADEPCVLELKDGRLWMVMRTQTGFLYEAFSEDAGETWSEARPARFVSSSSPAVLWRMPDGRILLLWNNCESSPRHNGQPVYCNRDALHAAVSDDEGETWRGFREVYRDPLENETPPGSDHGTAYPTLPVMVNGRIVFLTGQGAGRRNLVSLDPRWLTLTYREDDFSQGLGGWMAFKGIGAPRRYIRPRTKGPGLIDHPSKPGAKALKLAKSDEHAPDGALWNFPNGAKGTLVLRMMLRHGCQGACIALTDRSFKPTDDNSQRLAIFALRIDGEGQITGGPSLSPEVWHTLSLAWDLSKGACVVTVDDAQPFEMKQLNLTGNGISYLHLRSTADTIDEAGFLVERVRADIDDPIAPRRTPEQNQALLDRYIPSYYDVPAERTKAAQEELVLF